MWKRLKLAWAIFTGKQIPLGVMPIPWLEPMRTLTQSYLLTHVQQAMNKLYADRDRTSGYSDDGKRQTVHEWAQRLAKEAGVKAPDWETNLLIEYEVGRRKGKLSC